MTERDRRKPDPIQEQIEDLIMEAGEPKDKAFLIILNKIAGNLDENTELTRALRDEFTAHTEAFRKHETEEMALINQGRGFYRAATAAFLIVQAVLVWWGQQQLARIDSNAETVKAVEIEIAKHKEHHAQEEKYRDGPKVKP